MSEPRPLEDARFMQRALGLSSMARGTTSPNPPVGAVIVRDGAILGEGFTQPIGGPHAEVRAIADVGAQGHDCVGATMYVTLEPCRHHGRTPPCTEAIVRAGIARVVIGVLDPYEKMQGRSVEDLRTAGLSVDLAVEAKDCARAVLGFARAQQLGLPEVTAKAAVSLDGHIATASGESKWITGERARRDAQGLRARHDAVMVGIGTALADDPRLTMRLPHDVVPLSPEGQRAEALFGTLPRPGTFTDPTPVILDTDLRIPADARLFATGDALIFAAEDAPERDLPGTVVRVARAADGHVDVMAALRKLVEFGKHRVLVEGGGEVHRALFDAGVVDTLHLYVAGIVLVGGRAWMAGLPTASLAEAIRPKLRGVREVGDDVRLTYDVPHGLDPDAIERLASDVPGGR